MGLSGIRTLTSGGGGNGPPGPGNLVGAVSTNSIAMGIQSPGVSNILSATLLIGSTTFPVNTQGISLQVYAGVSPGLIGYFQTGGITELTSSVLQFAGPGLAVGGTFGIRVNQSSGSTSGFLSFADWNLFNNKAPTSRTIGSTYPLFGGGDLSADRVIGINPATGLTAGFMDTVGQTFAGDKTFLGVIAAQAGTLAAPGFHLSTDVGTGFFRAAVNQLNLGVAGATIMVWGSNNVSTSVPILGAPGTTGAPEFSFAADPDTGMYNPQANNLQFVVGSTGALNLQSGLMTMYLDQMQVPNGSALVPTYSFSTAAGAGVYLFGASQIGIAVGSTTAGYFDPSGYRTWRNRNIRWRDAGNLDLTVVAPTGFSNAMTWTLPLDQGTTNAFMKNDGTGQLLWQQNLVMNGSSTGTFTQNIGASLLSYAIKWPISQGGVSTIPINDGSGNLAWGAVTGSAASTNFARYSYDTTNGFGSTNNKVRKWVNNSINTDASGILTVSNSATNGLTITANVKVRISISYTDISIAPSEIGIVKNGTQGTTIIQSVTAADILARTATPTSNLPSGCSATDIAQINDYYWCQTDGGGAAAANNEAGVFIIAEQIA